MLVPEIGMLIIVIPNEEIYEFCCLYLLQLCKLNLFINKSMTILQLKQQAVYLFHNVYYVHFCLLLILICTKAFKQITTTTLMLI